MDIHAFIMLSCTLFVNFNILNVIGIGWFDSPQGPKQPGSGYSGTLRGQAACHNRKMYDLWGFGGVLHCKGFLRVKLAASS